MADRSASQGTELCAIAERILSCQTVVAATGDLTAADDLEIVAYNSLAATLSPDGRGCRYYCILNQPSCEDKYLGFANNGGRGDSKVQNGSICPGPHSGFGCCRSNFHFAWPKFVQSMWMRKEGGLAAVAYGPCTVSTEIRGKPVTLKMETDYPYSGKIIVRILSGGGTFPLFARVPSWTGLPDAGSLRKFVRDWKNGDVIELDFPMAVRSSFWEMGAVALMRGPVLFSLQMEAEERICGRYQVPFESRWIEGGGDFPRKEILPRSAWGYALLLDKNHCPMVTGIMGTGPEIRIAIDAVRTDFGGWGYMRDVTTGRAVDPPASPVPDENAQIETVRLMPMGETQIRVTLFPWLTKR